MEEQVLETWAIHNRIHLYLLNAIPEEDLPATPTGKGRSVYALFAHIHNVRLMWLKSAAPELLAGVEKIEPTPIGAKSDLKAALEASGNAVAELLRRELQPGGKVKGFKPHAVGFLGYLISHESHHRGQIEWALKQSGKPLPDSIAYGLWEWGTR
ncbi:MAG TPA: DinB family protein [Chthonomonadaceae bacterium]|nr:DinB family protein [Chthonomonadaceae bacterium]